MIKCVLVHFECASSESYQHEVYYGTRNQSISQAQLYLRTGVDEVAYGRCNNFQLAPEN